MKWVNHKILTFTVVFAFSKSLFGAIFASLGSTIPDALEVFLPGDKKKIHRTLTHWWVIYLIPVLVMWFSFKEFFLEHPLYRPSLTSFYLLLTANQQQELKIWLWSSFFVLIGCLLHILEDAFTVGKVPFLHPMRKEVGLKLFKTGSTAEFVFVLVISGLTLWIGLKFF